jgi:hypothetical protein
MIKSGSLEWLAACNAAYEQIEGVKEEYTKLDNPTWGEYLIQQEKIEKVNTVLVNKLYPSVDSPSGSS